MPEPPHTDTRGVQAHQPGLFVISLDLELYWGVRDQVSLSRYGPNILGVRQAVPAMLGMFMTHGIHATWAAVGILFCENKGAILRYMPDELPCYRDPSLSPYPALSSVGQDEGEDPYHYGLSLIRQIASHPSQEVGSHTFSHYYCLEPGQDLDAFRADLEAAVRAAAAQGFVLRSLVFPRNQYSQEHLAACAELGFRAYRGNERSWIYRPARQEDLSLARRAFRLADAYLRLSGPNCHRPSPGGTLPTNVASSRFLRPYSPCVHALERLRLRRILTGMTFAARSGSIYHLWWHPHNFGAHTQMNLSFLGRILEHYAHLRDLYGMQSRNLGEIALSLEGAHLGA